MSASAAVEKQREREQMKKEIKKELSQESINIKNSDGTTFARVMDIIGPAHMKPVVSNGVWKGTEQISEMNDEQGKEENEQPKEDPALKAKQKRADQIKKQVLLKKIQAVRQGAGENIMASYDAKKNVKEELVSERLGGKGYKPYTSLTGKKISGDWEDSDRGAGNKAKKRAGEKVEKKSPTYRAYVLNKEAKEEVVTESYNWRSDDSMRINRINVDI